MIRGTVCDSAEKVCQISKPASFSRLLRPAWLCRFSQLLVYVRRDGFRTAILRISRRAARMLGMKMPPSAGQTAWVLDLQPGDWVEVKSEPEIRNTLDSDGRNRGLAFLPDMARFCGRRFQVYKRLRKVFLEESRQIRSLKHTVLLSGTVCDGAGIGCDRSCLYYWREAWLRKTPIETQPPQDTLPAPCSR